MAVIPRLKKTTPSPRKQDRNTYYQDKLYRQIRDWYVKCHPLCELCEREGYINEDGTYNSIVKEGKDVHHKISFCNPNFTEEEKYFYLRDENNLIHLCRWHHNLVHGNIKVNKPLTT